MGVREGGEGEEGGVTMRRTPDVTVEIKREGDGEGEGV